MLQYQRALDYLVFSNWYRVPFQVNLPIRNRVIIKGQPSEHRAWPAGSFAQDRRFEAEILSAVRDTLSSLQRLLMRKIIVDSKVFSRFDSFDKGREAAVVGRVIMGKVINSLILPCRHTYSRHS